MPSKTRQKECDAFTQLADVCARYREVWCLHEMSNRAISRFYNSVNMLRDAIDNPEPDHYRPKPNSRHYRLPKEKVMMRLVDRVSGLYDRLEDPFFVSSQSDLLALLPPRNTMPTEEAPLVMFCTNVLVPLSEGPTGRKRQGGLGHAVRMLNAALDQYVLCYLPPKPMIQTKLTVGTYRRCLNSCIRVLIEMVDLCIPRYAEHPDFLRDYATARTEVMKLTVDARRTYHVHDYGAASLRHTRAQEWSPWNEPTGKERDLPGWEAPPEQ